MIAAPHDGQVIAAYVRVSSDKQDAERQRQSIKEWAARRGLAVDRWFEDTKGRNPRDKADKRVDFQRLLESVEDGHVQAVIVDSQDRFGTKDAYEFGKYVSQLRDNGCQLWSVAQGNLSADDPATILTSTVGAITSSREQEDKAHRNISGKIQKAKAGEYQGGYPPYGCDVVCFDANGKEKWRVVYDGHFARAKVSRGKKERYDGKDNFPAKDPTDTLGVRPSLIRDRIKTVHRIFRWYDEESISPAQIASRLNKMEVDPVFGDGWNKQKIRSLLTNPVYTGLPTFNKRGGSRFVEFVGGQFRKVEPIRGKVVAGRKRTNTDFVQPPKPLFSPIIPAELFDRTQRKLKASADKHRNAHRRASRTASLWLRNFLICGKCGKPMRGQASTKCRNVVSYFCGTYGTYGADNPTGCRCHRVKAELLHRIVEQYLAEADKKLSVMLQAEQRNGFDPAAQMASEFASLHGEIYDAFLAMHGQVDQFTAQTDSRKVMGEFGRNAQGFKRRPRTEQIPNLGSFAQLYEFVRQQRKPELEQRLSQLDNEHSKCVESLLSLPKGATAAIKKVNERILALEGEMHVVRGELKNVADEVEVILDDLYRRKKAIDKVRATVGRDSAYRRKAELLGQVVETIVCSFRYSETKGANKAKSHLDSVEIFPVEGDPVRCFPDGIKPGPG